MNTLSNTLTDSVTFTGLVDTCPHGIVHGRGLVPCPVCCPPTPSGWRCPICRGVYGPHVDRCATCSGVTFCVVSPWSWSAGRGGGR
jgi:hypothetical protein